MRVIVPVSFIIVGLGAACTVLAQRDAVRVDPATGIAGHYGTWTVIYQVGPAGLRPGAAVRAPALTRDAIFNALHQRRTYGTTGARILLEFRVNGEPMGGETVTDGAPRLDVAAHGTDVIDSVEILRYSEPDGGFRVVYDLQPDALDVEWSGTDGGFRADASGVRFAVASSWRGRAPSGSAVSPDLPATGDAHLTHDVCQMRFLTIRTGMEIRDCAYWCHAGRDIDALVSPRQNPYPAVAAPATAGVAPRQAARETGCFPTL